MKLQTKVAAFVILVLAVLIGCVVGITLVATSSEVADDELKVDIAGETFIDYYNNEKGANDDFEVHDVFMREDGNFLQGFYYDSNEN